jgi:uncharacterized SAM-binding protein YcdF (DUF218 family)
MKAAMSQTVDGTKDRRWVKRVFRRLGSAALLVLVMVACLMRWGGYLLESSDPVPAHFDVAVVLEGSLVGERVRLAGAMQLLQKGAAARVLLTIPPASYWGEPVPPMARHFLETNYGNDLAARVDFCDVGPDVDSTLQEAQAIDHCIQDHNWKSVVVVTSNYHTRRAGILWRRVMRKQNPSLQLSILGVDDPEFQDRGWWRKRLWAKTWLLEFTKLIWTETFGR